MRGPTRSRSRTGTATRPSRPRSRTPSAVPGRSDEPADAAGGPHRRDRVAAQAAAADHLAGQGAPAADSRPLVAAAHRRPAEHHVDRARSPVGTAAFDTLAVRALSAWRAGRRLELRRRAGAGVGG